uniref:Uncharacterized protein n=1 Tax=Oncorhynchus tshawytscha TaxID=74940 RepID=A0AAZ3P7I0_ONCTS
GQTCSDVSCFLGLVQSFSHYSAISQRLGVSLAQAREKGQLVFIEGLKESLGVLLQGESSKGTQALDFLRDPSSGLRGLYDFVRDNVRSAVGGGEEWGPPCDPGGCPQCGPESGGQCWGSAGLQSLLQSHCLLRAAGQIIQYHILQLHFSHLADALIQSNLVSAFILRYLGGTTTLHSHSKYIFPQSWKGGGAVG